MLAEQLPNFFNHLTVVADVAIVATIIVLLFLRNSGLAKFLRTYSLPLAFVVALVATLGSLAFSEIVGYEPCKLCWFQRIFMYPLPFLLGGALLQKNIKIAIYGLRFSVIGGAISIYHYYIQRFNIPTTCSADGGASCSDILSFGYGYISIPVMALSAFILIGIFSWLTLKKEG